MSDITGLTFDLDICRCCGKTILDDKKLLFNRLYHEKCYNLITKNKYQMYDNLEIKITYTKTTETHDGYCSDPRNETTETKTIIMTYPLYTMFDPKQSLDSWYNSDKLSVYDLKIESCKKGSGYCGNKTRYSITNTKLIKSKS